MSVFAASLACQDLGDSTSTFKSAPSFRLMELLWECLNSLLYFQFKLEAVLCEEKGAWDTLKETVNQEGTAMKRWETRGGGVMTTTSLGFFLSSATLMMTDCVTPPLNL